MSRFALPVQRAIFTRLDAQLSTTIYDDVPDTPTGMPEANFPFIVVGDDTAVAWDTDDSLGNECTVTLHIFSRYQGKKECKEIMQAVYTALNRQHENLVATGFRFTDCLFERAEILDLGDGKTRHGIVRYRLWIEEE